MSTSSYSPFSISNKLFKFIILSFSVATIVSAGADRTTEAGEAAINDPSVECTSYGLDFVSNAQKFFPDVNGVAALVPDDNTAAQKWSTIQGSVPNIQPKAIGDSSYPKDDPDCWWTFSNCVTPKAPGLPLDISDVPEPGTLGYGFDDGPFCGHNLFYDYLAEQNQTATMFYIGANVINFPLEAQRALTDGHEICVHTWSHSYMTSLTNEQAFAELYYTVSCPEMQAIKLVAGVTPTCWRPPYGDVDDRIRAIAQGLGLRTIIWGYDSDDWEVGSLPTSSTPQAVDANYQKMIGDANNGKFASAGAIILAHELNNFTMSEAMKMYPILSKAFDHIVPVGVALNITQPYVEQNFTQPSFSDYISGKLSSSVPIAKQADNSSSSLASSPSGITKSSSSSASTASTPVSSDKAQAASATPTHKSAADALAINSRISVFVPATLLLFVTGLRKLC